MPEHLRALLVILLISTFVFAYAKKSIGPIITPVRFNQWRNTWFVITIIAFVSSNFWFYIVVSGLFVLYVSRREPNKLALFMILLFAVPSIGSYVSGFGVVNYLIEINHFRLLSLVILLPASIALLRSRQSLPLGKFVTDKLILAYLILTVLMQLRDTTLTDTLRQGFYALTDVFLPYFVASRGLKQYGDFKHAISAFLLASLMVAAIGIFEFIKHWLLYVTLSDSWNLSGLGGYLARDGNLRALASLGQPIVLGYVLTIALGFYLYLSPSIRSKNSRRVGLAILALGLVAPLSRGPWVGAAVMITVFLATGPNPVKRLSMLAMAAALAIPLLFIVPGGNKVINLLPFIGNTEKANIEYRDKLFDNSMIVIKRNLLFGSVNFKSTPEMQELIQGQGIIDIVNTYIRVALDYGMVGLGLFAGVFISALLQIRKAGKSVSDKASEVHLLGRSLFAAMVAMLVMIATVSSISAIPVIYWLLAGMGVAYANMVRQYNQTEHSKN